MTLTHPIDLHRIQKIRKAAVLASLLALIGAAVLTQSWGGVDGPWHEGVEALGLAAMIVSIVGRAWCSLYIGGRKTAEVVDVGPYSVTRNPLYLFSFVGAFGIGCQSGSLSIGLLAAVAAIGVFHLTVRKEESWLEQAFGQAYRDYLARTPRFLPRPSLWRDAPELTIRPAFFLLTIRDGLVFLLAIPVFEAIDAAQAAGWLPVFAHLI